MDDYFEVILKRLNSINLLLLVVLSDNYPGYEDLLADLLDDIDIDEIGLDDID